MVAATDVGTTGKFIEPVTLPSTGTYTIKVDPQGANTGGITLGLANFGSDTTGTITASGVGRGRHFGGRGPERDADLHGLREPAHRAQPLERLDRDDVLGRQGVGEVAHDTTVVAPVVVGTNGRSSSRSP